jgi:hypothetical protein
MTDPDGASARRGIPSKATASASKQAQPAKKAPPRKRVAPAGLPKEQSDQVAAQAHVGEGMLAGRVFTATFGITLLSMAGMIGLSFFSTKFPDAKGAADTCSTVFKMGVGVIFGMVSGRAK